MPSQRFLPISSSQISPHLRRCDKMRGRGIGRNGAIETSETTEPGMSDWQLWFSQTDALERLSLKVD